MEEEAGEVEGEEAEEQFCQEFCGIFGLAELFEVVGFLGFVFLFFVEVVCFGFGVFVESLCFPLHLVKLILHLPQ